MALPLQSLPGVRAVLPILLLGTAACAGPSSGTAFDPENHAGSVSLEWDSSVCERASHVLVELTDPWNEPYTMMLQPCRWMPVEFPELRAGPWTLELRAVRGEVQTHETLRRSVPVRVGATHAWLFALVPLE